MPRIALPRVDFPQPVSPTTPKVSPSARSNVTPSTARTGPRFVR